MSDEAQVNGGGPVQAQAIPAEESVQVSFVGVASEEEGHKVILKERQDSQGQVEMYVGGSEFVAIAKELGLVESGRPMTHELYTAILDGLEVDFQRVEIYGLSDNAYLARLFYSKKGQAQTLEVRPSDGVALALRRRLPIYINKRLLKGILSPRDQATLSDLVKVVKF